MRYCALSGSAVFLLCLHVDAMALIVVKDEYQEETGNEDTIFWHPARPRYGAGADTGNVPDGKGREL